MSVETSRTEENHQIRKPLRKPSHGKPVNVAEAIRLYNEGLSMTEVGRRLGHRHGIIRYHLKRNNIPIRDPRIARRKPVSNERIKDLYEVGYSAPMIGKKLNITHQCVYDRLVEVGIKTRNRREQINMMIKRGTYNVHRGSESTHWKGGRTIDRNGYVSVYVGGRDKRGHGRYVLEHRHVWEQANGKLPDGWIVHHLNGDRQDNRIENLIAMPRSNHSPKKIADIYRKRIKELEAQIKDLKAQQSMKFTG